jgi:hypothetical protein
MNKVAACKSDCRVLFERRRKSHERTLERRCSLGWLRASSGTLGALGEEVRQGAFLGEKGGAVDKLRYAAMKSTSREQRNKVEHNRKLIGKMDSERAGRVREADIVLYSRIWRFLSVNARHSAFYFGWRAVKGLLDFCDRH